MEEAEAEARGNGLSLTGAGRSGPSSHIIHLSKPACYMVFQCSVFSFQFLLKLLLKSSLEKVQ